MRLWLERKAELPNSNVRDLVNRIRRPMIQSCRDDKIPTILDPETSNNKLLM